MSYSQKRNQTDPGTRLERLYLQNSVQAKPLCISNPLKPRNFLRYFRSFVQPYTSISVEQGRHSAEIRIGSQLSTTCSSGLPVVLSVVLTALFWSSADTVLFSLLPAQLAALAHLGYWLVSPGGLLLVLRWWLTSGEARDRSTRLRRELGGLTDRAGQPADGRRRVSERTTFHIAALQLFFAAPLSVFHSRY